ncbi:MAG: hypothetical protein ABW023_14610 [Sphingomonas sp.]
MIVNLHIDRLVLDGLPVGTHEGPLVQAAVEAELARLLGNALPSDLLRAQNISQMRAEPIRANQGGAEGLGSQIGQAVFGGISR